MIPVNRYPISKGNPPVQKSDEDTVEVLKPVVRKAAFSSTDIPIHRRRRSAEKPMPRHGKCGFKTENLNRNPSRV